MIGLLKKLLLGVLLVAAAAFVSFVLKDALERSAPQYAVPQMTVAAGGVETVIPAVGYDWAFPFGQTAGETPPPIQAAFNLGIIPKIELYGGEALELRFSQGSRYALVDRSIEPYNYDFFLPAEGEGAVPFAPGYYGYMVDALFEQGSVQYYFTVSVRP